MKMRLMGLTYNQIVSEIGKWASKENIKLPKNYDERKAFIDVDRELSKVCAENKELREQLFKLENDRLDAMQVGIWQEAAKGNEKKIDRILKIMDRRSRYWGLDAPIKGEFSGKDGGAIPIVILPDNGVRLTKIEEDE